MCIRDRSSCGRCIGSNFPLSDLCFTFPFENKKFSSFSLNGILNSTLLFIERFLNFPFGLICWSRRTLTSYPRKRAGVLLCVIRVFSSKGMAEVLAAYNCALIADMFGDAPCSQAALVDENGSPVYLTPKMCIRDRSCTAFRNILPFQLHHIEEP